jgi:alpha-N-arabinofuranosidase
MKTSAVAAALAASAVAFAVVVGCDPTCSGICIVVDASQPKHVISPLLFGDQIEWLQSGTYLYDRPASASCDPSLEGAAPRPSLLSPLAGLGVTLLRYPGGTVSDFFHWAQAVGPVSQRTPQIDPWDSDYLSPVTQCPLFGPDEAAQTAGALHAGLLVTANAGSGTPQEAADWLSYYEARGAYAYWEVGNEIYIPGDANGEPYSFGAVHESSTAYAAQFDAYASALRARDPAAKVGAVGNDDFAGWDQTVLSNATQKIDFFSVHFAYAPAWCTDPAASQEKQFKALMAAPVVVRYDLDQLESTIGHYARPASAGMTVAVDEHAGLFGACPGDGQAQQLEELRRDKSLGAALYSAMDLNLFLADPRIGIANHFNLASPFFQAALNTEMTDGWSNPVVSAWGKIFPLYARAIPGGRFLASNVVGSPTFSTEAYGITPALAGVPSIDSVSVLNGSVLTIFVVNRDLTQTITARVVAGNFAPASSVTADQVTGATYDAVNTPQVPDAVTLTTRSLSVSKDFSYPFPPHSLTRLTFR